MGVPISGGSGSPMIHFEIVAQNEPQQKLFYQNVLNWKYSTPENTTEYTQIMPSEPPNGGFRAVEQATGKFIPVFKVDNLAATRTLVTSNGGTMIITEKTHPQGGLYATFKDPEDNLICIYQPPGDEAPG